jgi:hypothetical protein
LGLALAQALLATDCKDRLQALGAPERWFDECPERHATHFAKDLNARTSVRFSGLREMGQITAVDLVFRGPDEQAARLKAERTGDCSTTGESSWTSYEPLRRSPGPCKAGFWEDIPIVEQPGLVAVACAENGKWRIVSPAEIAPAR